MITVETHTHTHTHTHTLTHAHAHAHTHTHTHTISEIFNRFMQGMYLLCMKTYDYLKQDALAAKQPFLIRRQLGTVKKK